MPAMPFVFLSLSLSLPNHRPKICLEKCDANISKPLPMVQKTPSAAPIVPEKDLRICESKNRVDLQADASEFKVPNEYEYILKKPAFVKLIKYDNIENVFNTLTSGSQTPVSSSSQ